jgi:5-methylcytosine-specific restriction endonuclease McrA
MPTVNKIRKPPSDKDPMKALDDFYHLSPWRKIRKVKITLQPLCEYCLSRGKSVLATIVDHYLTRSLWPELALVFTNLVSCCGTCHQKKRAIEGQYSSKWTLALKLKEKGFINESANFIESLKK